MFKLTDKKYDNFGKDDDDVFQIDDTEEEIDKFVFRWWRF